MMRLCKALGAWALIALLVAGIGLAVFNPKVEVDLSQEQANQIVTETMPVNKRLMRFDYTLHSVTLEFLENGHIQVIGEMDIGARYGALIQAEGQLVYRDGAFYVAGLDIQDVKFESLEPNPVEDDLIIIGRDAAGQLFGSTPESAAALQRLEERLYAPMRDAAEGLVARTLETTPVYTLDTADAKQNLARMALYSVDVSADNLTVTLAARTVVFTIAMYVLSLVAAIGLAFALFRSGGSGFLAVLVLAGGS